jgi:hypothetical protein
MKEYLGVTPESDAKGCLQDVHCRAWGARGPLGHAGRGACWGAAGEPAWLVAASAAPLAALAALGAEGWWV